MAINTHDQLINAMGNNYQDERISKASLANTVAGQTFSLWASAGLPAAGAAPTTAATPDNTTLGGAVYTNASGGNTLYAGLMQVACSNSGGSLIAVDRVGHMGGLSGTSTSPQTVGVDLTALSSARKGLSNLSEIEWYLEWYTDTGATASNATINVTYSDATSEDLALVAVGGTVRAGRMIPLVPATAGKFIQSVNTITLSASTTVAGNFGVTATRRIAEVSTGLANYMFPSDWSTIGMPVVPASACIAFINRTASSSTGTFFGLLKLIAG